MLTANCQPMPLAVLQFTTASRDQLSVPKELHTQKQSRTFVLFPLTVP
jgi:hypothetical protein